MLDELLERTAAVRNAVLGVGVHFGVGELVVSRLEHRVPPKQERKQIQCCGSGMIYSGSDQKTMPGKGG